MKKVLNARAGKSLLFFLLLLSGSFLLKADNALPYVLKGSKIHIVAPTAAEQELLDNPPPVITYKWIRTTNVAGCSYAGVWDTIPSATAATYDPGPLTQTTYYKRITYSNLNGVVCSAISNCVTITVVPDPTVQIVGAGPVCVGGTVQLTANVSGGTGTYTVEWYRK